MSLNHNIFFYSIIPVRYLFNAFWPQGPSPDITTKQRRQNLSVYKQRLYQETASFHVHFMFHTVINFLNAVILKHL